MADRLSLRLGRVRPAGAAPSRGGVAAFDGFGLARRGETRTLNGLFQSAQSGVRCSRGAKTLLTASL